MQTFLPYPEYLRSAQTLDRQRLGKQRVEAWQILTTLTSGAKAWSHHPAVLMWKGYEPSLALYGIVVCTVWKEQGYNDTLLPRFTAYILDWFSAHQTCIHPPWLGDENFHSSHRANLLRKNEEHYSQYGWTESPDMPYVWPVQIK